MKARRWKGITAVVKLGTFLGNYVAVCRLSPLVSPQTRLGLIADSDWQWHDVGQVTIDTLPSVALIEIFDIYLSAYSLSWPTLVHVCRRWRDIVFRSPRRLNLELYCTFGRPARAALDIWPPLPISICGYSFQKKGGDVDNIVAALEHRDRVCKINLWDATSLDLELYLPVMREPFSALTSLVLRRVNYDVAEVARFPDSESFLGGSAPHLKSLTLSGIPLPFPGLQNLLLSAKDLVDLHLQNISHSVYFSPDAIVAVISTLTKLEQLELTFQSPRSRPIRENRLPPPITLILLPALTKLTFQGVSGYLEDLVAQIDVPQLQGLSVTFFHQLFFHTPQLSRFIGRAPRLKGYDEARVVFTHLSARVTLRLPSRPNSRVHEIRVAISCRHPDLQFLSLVQVCTSSFPHIFITRVKHLYVLESRGYQEDEWDIDLEDWRNNTQWLQLLRPFVAVKNFYISEKFVPLIAPALRELVGERITEALPAMECLFLDGLRASGPVRDAIGPFIAVRQPTTHPIIASYWDSEEEDWWEYDD